MTDLCLLKHYLILKHNNKTFTVLFLNLRQKDFNEVVEELLATHDNGQVNEQFLQASSWITLKSNQMTTLSKVKDKHRILPILESACSTKCDVIKQNELFVDAGTFLCYDTLKRAYMYDSIIQLKGQA